ncbi:MAG TPA: leucyl/phenylalanyl-tRNA--protein transferase [Gemmataceae bacterium]|nr:leucyl/phenylalanyl-tRNA--protein transferase [Gemmataceae bacterium]
MPRPLRLDPEAADAHGLVAVGGDLRPETLLDAYRRGVFPWYDEAIPVCWWSPNPRAIIPLDHFHVSRRLTRTIRSGRFEVTFDQDFAGVMRACADRAEGTWITRDMLAAYQRLHKMGYAHSVEARREGTLAGGVYGVATGGLFSAESMFYRATDASKVALAALVERLRARDYLLLDVQMSNEHTARLGAVEIPRTRYLAELERAVRLDRSFAEFTFPSTIPSYRPPPRQA